MDECNPLRRGPEEPAGTERPARLRGELGRGAKAVRRARGGQGLHSFPLQLNLSSSVHRKTQLNSKIVLNLLKWSSNVNECKPLVAGDHGDGGGGGRCGGDEVVIDQAG